MKLRARARVEIPAEIEPVYDLAVDLATFPRILQAQGPIPGIARIEMEPGATPAPGARRRVSLTDGSSIGEEILDLTRPTRHHYRWLEPPKPPFSWLVRGGEGDWRFSREGGGTVIEWIYTFTLTSAVVAPLAAPVVWLFRRWMATGLERLRAELIAASASGGGISSTGAA